MANPQLVQTRYVVIADLNKLDVELSIRAAIDYYRTLYGEPKRVWINPKDCDDKIQEVEGYKVERRGGCCRMKVMVI